MIDTTVGKIIFNQPIPQDLGFVDRTLPANQFKLEIDFLVGKKPVSYTHLDVYKRQVAYAGGCAVVQVNFFAPRGVSLLNPQHFQFLSHYICLLYTSRCV